MRNFSLMGVMQFNAQLLPWHFWGLGFRLDWSKTDRMRKMVKFLIIIMWDIATSFILVISTNLFRLNYLDSLYSLKVSFGDYSRWGWAPLCDPSQRVIQANLLSSRWTQKFNVVIESLKLNLPKNLF